MKAKTTKKTPAAQPKSAAKLRDLPAKKNAKGGSRKLEEGLK